MTDYKSIEILSIIDNLSIITNSFTRKRLIREICFLYENNDNELIFIDITTIDSFNSYLSYAIKIYQPNKNIFYIYIFTNNYPYAPPKLYINNKPYLDYLSYKNPFYKYKKFRNFCNKTILSCENWRITTTILNVIDETYEYKNCCKKILNSKIILNKLLISKIQKKYLIQDINLIQWLY